MLHKSFKPAKCKTALKLAASRIKLLKNKRDAQVKQLKRELAQLLEAGQDQTARIRVEHVVREEKTMAAYDLIEIYCELIVARLPIIESQKNCPIDLKEAISSVIFASPRCADIPELMDVRKHFTAKYGKDFVSAAVELRPDCGVSRLLVEKLSAKAPDFPTKIKILRAIAEEHNIKWDPKSFEDNNKKSPGDLLNGPNTTFEQTSKIQPDQQNIQQPSDGNNRDFLKFEHVSEHHGNLDTPTNTSGLDPNSSYPQNFPSVGADTKMPSSTAHQSLEAGGTRSQGMELRYSRTGDRSGLPGDSLKMEFKDATAAAQAAAESAERASMAARAAAELSSRGRMSTQHSMEKQSHPAYGSQDDGFHSDLNSRWQGEYHFNHPASDTFGNRDSTKHHQQEQIDENEPDHLADLTARFYNLKNSNSGSQRDPSSFPPDDYPSTNDLQMADQHFRNSSSEFQKSVSRFENEKKTDDVARREENSRQASNIISHSHSLADEHEHVDRSPSPRNSDEDTLETPFTFHETETQRSSRDINSHANASAVFDNSGSDGELIEIYGKEHGRDSNYFSVGGLQSSEMLESKNIWSPRHKTGNSFGRSNSQSPFASEQNSSTLFSESTSDTLPVEADASVPISFDDSEGEDDLDKFKVVENDNNGDVSAKVSVSSSNPLLTQSESPRFKESSFKSKEDVGYNRKPELQYSSHDSDAMEAHGEKSDDISKYGKSKISLSSPRHKKTLTNLDGLGKSEMGFETLLARNNMRPNVSVYDEEATRYEEDSSLETGKELNLGLLTGGLRNRGYKHPPYRRGPPNYSSTKQAAEDASPRIEQSISIQKSEISARGHDQEPHNQQYQKANRQAQFAKPTFVDSDEEDLVDEFPKWSSAQESLNQRVSNDINVKSRTYFDSENSDSEDDIPKPTLTTRRQSGSGVSRRTKAFASHSDRNSGISMKAETSLPTDAAVERKPYSRRTYATGSYQGSSSDLWGSSELPRSLEQADFKSRSHSKYSVLEESSPTVVFSSDKQQSTQSQSKILDHQGSSGKPRSTDMGTSKPVMESKRSTYDKDLEAPTRKQAPSPPGVAGSPNNASFASETPSRENSHNKASHVHPKLPDYDTFAAHLLSLRKNRP